ncbi:hypothetical protein GGS20DRAFT_576262 [Poronia punctata]|nr:hypothetical protein GGS20DRAFT_576262 [Poronia punctata]
MGGLIPLLLSTTPDIMSSAATLISDTRWHSSSIWPTASSEHQAKQRQEPLPPPGQAKQVSSMSSVVSVPAIPRTAQEWRLVMDEVKRKYLARKYRSCSMRCSEILDSLGESWSAEPLHLIYLHFFAASSFEWCAWPLSPTSASAQRNKLLYHAQAHYAEAEAQIKLAECATADRARSPSLASTVSTIPLDPCFTSPTCPSPPAFSTGSRASSGGYSSAASSPRTSMASSFAISRATSSGEVGSPVRAKPNKKVSFSGLSEFFEFQPEPFIRPDSPTLGWSDDTMSGPTPKMEATFYPAPLRVSRTKTPPPPRDLTADYDQVRRSTSSEQAFNLESSLQTRSLDRLKLRLSALGDQIRRHRAAVDDLLAGTSDATPHADTRKPLPPNTPIAQTTGRYLPVVPSQPRLQERIERLRGSGWQRRRFDARRYEALREEVLGELGELGTCC